MSTLDDRLLGEKLHYYCSSSESDSDDDTKDCDQGKSNAETRRCEEATIPEPKIHQWEGSSVNTGPKGVLSDWQRYKQLECEKREQQEKEKLMLIKKLALTCRSELDDQKSEKQDESLRELLDDTFLQEYMQKRMEEMMKQSYKQPLFGKMLKLQSGQEFLEAVDKEPKSISVIIHIFKEDNSGCEAMNGCLQCLASEYPHVKFCCIEASSARMSRHFEESGVPALLVYKGGNMIGNFVRLTDEFGDDFFAVDVENFLIEHGMLPDQKLVPPIIQSSNGQKDDDSDFDVE